MSLTPNAVLNDLIQTTTQIGPPGPPSPTTALLLRRKKALVALVDVMAAQDAQNAGSIALCRGFAAESDGLPPIFPLAELTQPEAADAAYQALVGRKMAQSQPLDLRDEVAIVLREAYGALGINAIPALPGDGAPDGWVKDPLLATLSFYVHGGQPRGFVVTPDPALRAALQAVNARDLAPGQFYAYRLHPSKEGRVFLGGYAEQGQAENALVSSLAA